MKCWTLIVDTKDAAELATVLTNVLGATRIERADLHMLGTDSNSAPTCHGLTELRVFLPIPIGRLKP